MKSKNGNHSPTICITSFGGLYPQLNNPAEFIRDQFHRVAHAIPTDVVKPSVLRKKIKNRGLPVPNYFLDPEDPKQFPPHIALLVILQTSLTDGEDESSNKIFGELERGHLTNPVLLAHRDPRILLSITFLPRASSSVINNNFPSFFFFSPIL
jgi:hypothetical protein